MATQSKWQSLPTEAINPVSLAVDKAPVPAGRYTITVRATPKETVYGRAGVSSLVKIPVCTSGGGGGGEPRALSVPGGRRLQGSGDATVQAGGC